MTKFIMFLLRLAYHLIELCIQSDVKRGTGGVIGKLKMFWEGNNTVCFKPLHDTVKLYVLKVLVVLIEECL